MVTVGVCSSAFDVAGQTIAAVRVNLEALWGIPERAVALVNGDLVYDEEHILREEDDLDFVVDGGRKAVGENVWDEKQFCEFFHIAVEDLHAWIAQGLKVARCLDGSIRITESAYDEFCRGKVIESPYLNSAQAAAYCNLTLKAFYARVERRKITPLPGSGKENLFTREQCDRMMKGQ